MSDLLDFMRADPVAAGVIVWCLFWLVLGISVARSASIETPLPGDDDEQT